MDDVLSALDARVAREVFANVLSADGYLAGKTRVLATHTMWCLPLVDSVLLLAAGRIRAQGSFGELVEAGIDFATMILEEQGDAAEGTSNQNRLRAADMTAVDTSGVKLKENSVPVSGTLVLRFLKLLHARV